MSNLHLTTRETAGGVERIVQSITGFGVSVTELAQTVWQASARVFESSARIDELQRNFSELTQKIDKVNFDADVNAFVDVEAGEAGGNFLPLPPGPVLAPVLAPVLPRAAPTPQPPPLSCGVFKLSDRK